MSDLSLFPRTRRFAAFSLLTLAGGCSLVYSDDIAKKQCSDAADCTLYAEQLGTPLVCRSSACQAPFCSSTSDCPGGASCVQNLCIAPRPDAGTPPAACTQDSDCMDVGARCGFDGFCYAKWGCLDRSPDWATLAPNLTLEFTARHIVALENPAALGVLTAAACGPSDLACLSPIVGSQSISISNDKVVRVPFSGVPERGFIGFVRLGPSMAAQGLDGGIAPNADGGAAQLLPNYVHFTTETPLIDDLIVQHRLLMIDSATFELFATATGVPLDQSKGSVGLQVYDCGGRSAPDVTLIASGYGGAYFTPVQGESLPIIGRDTTDASGAGIMINLRPDTLQTFILRDVVQERTVSDALNFIVKGGAINYVSYYPRQSAVKKWMDHAQKQGIAQ